MGQVVWGVDYKGRRVDPALLHPVLVSSIALAVKPLPADYLCTFGIRTRADQIELHERYLKGGPRAAAPGLSAHEYGLAVDLVPDGDPAKPGIQTDWQPTPGDGWYELKDAIWRSPKLDSWGQRTGKDWPHVQLLNWKRYVGWNGILPPPGVVL